jgi:hypothetical protein
MKKLKNIAIGGALVTGSLAPTEEIQGQGTGKGIWVGPPFGRGNWGGPSYYEEIIKQTTNSTMVETGMNLKISKDIGRVNSPKAKFSIFGEAGAYARPIAEDLKSHILISQVWADGELIRDESGELDTLPLVKTSSPGVSVGGGVRFGTEKLGVLAGGRFNIPLIQGDARYRHTETDYYGGFQYNHSLSNRASMSLYAGLFGRYTRSNNGEERHNRVGPEITTGINYKLTRNILASFGIGYKFKESEAYKGDIGVDNPPIINANIGLNYTIPSGGFEAPKPKGKVRQSKPRHTQIPCPASQRKPHHRESKTFNRPGEQ